MDLTDSSDFTSSIWQGGALIPWLEVLLAVDELNGIKDKQLSEERPPLPIEDEDHVVIWRPGLLGISVTVAFHLEHCGPDGHAGWEGVSLLSMR